MNRISKRTGVVFLLVLLLMSGVTFFVAEFIAMSDDWVIYTGSPHIYKGDNLNCGVVIDRENLLLADLRNDRIYSSSSALRKATVHWLGDRYGSISAPSLSAYASQIAGYDRINGVYHYANSGGIIQLTLSGKLQEAALAALGDRKGTVAVYNYKTGQILCSVTTPTYDPDNVPDFENDTTGAYEGVYLNRFTQAVYTPGSIFKIVTLAAALEEIADIQSQYFTCTGNYQIGTESITCERAHGKQTLKQAFNNSCNCAFGNIALELGAQTLESYAEKFAITEAVSFDGITTASGNFDVVNAPDLLLAWSGVGQHTDLINPCSFLRFVGAIAAGGSWAEPYLVDNITVAQNTTYTAQTKYGEKILSEQTVSTLQQYLRSNVSERYGDQHFPGLNVCAKTGTAEVGGAQRPNAMLAGFVVDEAYPLAFIVCVEDAGYGSTVCIPIAAQVLNACKSVLDS